MYFSDKYRYFSDFDDLNKVKLVAKFYFFYLSTYSTYLSTAVRQRHGRPIRQKQVFRPPFSQMLTDLDVIWQGSVIAPIGRRH